MHMLTSKDKLKELSVSNTKRNKFLGVVVLPTVLTALYFAAIATPVYRSTTTIMVNNPSHETGGMSAFLSGGTGDSMTGAFMTKEFTNSWGEFKALDNHFDLHKFWGQGDIISSYYRLLGTDLGLYHFYKSHVDTNIDKKSGIITIDTYAYSSKQASGLSTQLLHDTEDRINLINHQKDVDFTVAARTQLEEAQHQVDADIASISQFRKQTGYYRPDLDYSAAVQAQSSLNGDLAKAKADYSGVNGSTPGNPMMGGLRDQIASYQNDSKALTHQRSAINSVAKQYDVLENKRVLDTAMMEKAGSVVQDTILKSAGDHYYVQIISAPSEPNSSEFPRSILDTFLVFMVLLIGYRFLLV